MTRGPEGENGLAVLFKTSRKRPRTVRRVDLFHRPRLLVIPRFTSCSTLVILLVVALTAPVARAQGPSSLSYQGTLETAGQPVTAPSATLTFRLFSAPTGGSALWTETKTGIVIQDGLFAADLGTVTPLGPELFFGPLYLSVAVGGTGAAQLSPRTPLRSAPYARTLVAPAQMFGENGGPLLSVQNIAGGATGNGLYAETSASEGRAVYGLAGAGSGVNAGVFGESASTGGYGVYGSSPNVGVYGTSSLNIGMYGVGNTIGVVGRGNDTGVSASGQETGVRGAAGAADGVGVVGDAPGSGGIGVKGTGSGLNGVGVLGEGEGRGVIGSSPFVGVLAIVPAGSPVPNNYGVYAQNESSGIAGYFSGNVTVTGTLAKGGGAFQIDHPLDPAGRILRHSFVESPDMMNVYNGNTTTDAQGYVTVTLPDYFEALNRDIRYQLTTIGSFSRAMVAEEVVGNRFVIRTEEPGVRVSWQVTGIRHDAWANANRIVVEEDKPADEQGRYLHPAAFGLDREQGIGYDAVHEALIEQARVSRAAPLNQ